TCPELRWRVLEATRELDFLVPAGGHARDRALDVLFHLVTHSVELQADALDARGPGGARQAGQPGRHGRAAEQREKTAAIAHGFTAPGASAGPRRRPRRER